MKKPILLALLTAAALMTISALFVQKEKDDYQENIEHIGRVARNQWADIQAGETTKAYDALADTYKLAMDTSSFKEKTTEVHVPDAYLAFTIDSINLDKQRGARKATVVATAKNNSTTTAFHLQYELVKSSDRWLVNKLEIGNILNAYAMRFEAEVPEGFTPVVHNYYTMRLKGPKDTKDGKRWINMYFSNFALTENNGVYEDLTDFIYKEQKSFQKDLRHYHVESEGEFVYHDKSGKSIVGYQFTYSGMFDNRRVKGWNIDLLYAGAVRTFSFDSAAENYDEYLPVAQKVVASWKFTE